MLKKVIKRINIILRKVILHSSTTLRKVIRAQKPTSYRFHGPNQVQWQQERNERSGEVQRLNQKFEDTLAIYKQCNESKVGLQFYLSFFDSVASRPSYMPVAHLAFSMEHIEHGDSVVD
jgi:hypothetical protein